MLEVAEPRNAHSVVGATEPPVHLLANYVRARKRPNRRRPRHRKLLGAQLEDLHIHMARLRFSEASCYITAADAQLERGILVERVCDGMDRARREGRHPSSGSRAPRQTMRGM